MNPDSGFIEAHPKLRAFLLTPSGGWEEDLRRIWVHENVGVENKPRRKRRSREQIAELVREFKSSGLTQRKFSENRGIALSELQRSVKIVRRASEAQLMAVQIEAAERNDRGLELMVGEGYRIKIEAGFCSDRTRPIAPAKGATNPGILESLKSQIETAKGQSLPKCQRALWPKPTTTP